MTLPAEEMPRRCPGIKRDGSACPVPSELLIEEEDAPGTWWCFNHHPDYEDAREVARMKGGTRTALRNRRHRFLDKTDLGALKTPEDAQRWSAVIAESVATGVLNGSAARSALAAVELFVRSLEVVDHEARLAQLEQRASEDESLRQREAALRAAERRRTGADYLRRDTAPTGNGT